MAHIDDLATPARRDFLKRFFHDIATPLSAVSLHLEGADRRVRRGIDPTESLTVARTELAKAFDLFDRGREFLLEDPEPAAPFDLDPVAAAAAAEHPGVRLEGATGASVIGGHRALAAALAALIVNAVEAAGAESVRVLLGREDGHVFARVENPGSLQTDNTDALFSPKSARRGKVWGMGLSRARVAAADAGGTLRIEQDGDRVVATLDLPEGPR
ncbi:MAG: hypothetical protein LC796_04795 [Acidobacteria bacterium]|nr:hypothetical protein [Acidobacteriota bacterium]